MPLIVRGGAPLDGPGPRRLAATPLAQSCTKDCGLRSVKKGGHILLHRVHVCEMRLTLTLIEFVLEWLHSAGVRTHARGKPFLAFVADDPAHVLSGLGKISGN